MAVTGTKIVTVTFNGTRNANTRKLFQYDYGQSYYFKDLELPEVFEVHFSNKPKDGKAKTMIGQNQYVDIPDEYLTTGLPVYAWIFLHNGSTDGETRYTIQTGVTPKSKLENAEPTPVQQDTITRTIAVLNEAVDKSEQSAEDSEAWAVGQRDGVDVETGDETYHNNSKYYSDLSKGASESAETSATNAHTSELNAHASEQNAYSYMGRSETAATNAEASKNAANQSAISADRSARDASASEVNAAQSAATANEAQRDAMNYSTRAETAERNASASATQAETFATNAQISATNAQVSATNSANSASETEGYKDSASTSALQANAKATEASNSATSAQQSATNAANSASDAAASASAANDAKTAAETAWGKAEDAITEAIAALNVAVEQSETNVTHYPRIIDGYWNVWDAQTEAFVSTGVEAQGEKGDGGLSVFMDIPCDLIPTGADRKMVADYAMSFRVYAFSGSQRKAITDISCSSFSLQTADGVYHTMVMPNMMDEYNYWTVSKNIKSTVKRVGSSVYEPLYMEHDTEVLTLTVTVDGETFTLKHSITAAKQGEKGDKGDVGEGAVNVFLRDPVTLIPTDADGYHANQQIVSTYVYAFKDGEPATITSVTATPMTILLEPLHIQAVDAVITVSGTSALVKYTLPAGTGLYGNKDITTITAVVDGESHNATMCVVSARQGETGNGIASIEKTGTSGLVDTYTITFDDDTTETYQVTNGADGDDYILTAADKQEIAAEVSDMFVVEVTGRTPTITAQANTRYVCGELDTLDFTPSVAGICDIIFTSGTTATVLTLPNTVKMPSGFSVAADTVYELNFLAGLGVYQTWAVT